MAQTLNNILSKERVYAIFAFIVIWLILLLNSLHESYPDEFDNILGGWLILKGSLPYTGFFSHHGALSYYFASIITLLGGQSFVHFRLLTSFFFLGVFAFTYWIFK